MPGLLRQIPEHLVEQLVLPRVLVPQLLVDPAAASVFRDLLTPRSGDGKLVHGSLPPLGLLSLPTYRRAVIPFFLDCLQRRQRAIRLVLLINLPRAAYAFSPDVLRRTLLPEVGPALPCSRIRPAPLTVPDPRFVRICVQVKLGLQDVDDEIRVRSFVGLCAITPLVVDGATGFDLRIDAAADKYAPCLRRVLAMPCSTRDYVWWGRAPGTRLRAGRRGTPSNSC